MRPDLRKLHFFLFMDSFLFFFISVVFLIWIYRVLKQSGTFLLFPDRKRAFLYDSIHLCHCFFRYWFEIAQKLCDYDRLRHTFHHLHHLYPSAAPLGLHIKAPWFSIRKPFESSITWSNCTGEGLLKPVFRREPSEEDLPQVPVPGQVGRAVKTWRSPNPVRTGGWREQQNGCQDV